MQASLQRCAPRGVEIYAAHPLGRESVRQTHTYLRVTIRKIIIIKKEKTMKEKLQKIREHAMAEIENSDGLAKLNDVRVAVLGKKGELTAVLKGMMQS